MRQSSWKIRSRCVPALARERSSRSCSATRSSGVSCILGEKLLGPAALRLGQPYMGMPADRARRDADVAQHRSECQRRHTDEPPGADLPLPALMAGGLGFVGDDLFEREDPALAVLARR